MYEEMHKNKRIVHLCVLALFNYGKSFFSPCFLHRLSGAVKAELRRKVKIQFPALQGLNARVYLPDPPLLQAPSCCMTGACRLFCPAHLWSKVLYCHLHWCKDDAKRQPEQRQEDPDVNKVVLNKGSRFFLPSGILCLLPSPAAASIDTDRLWWGPSCMEEFW